MFEEIVLLKDAEPSPISDRDRLRFLAEAGLALVSSLDYASTLQRIAELSLGLLADYCIFDVLEDTNLAVRVAWAHRDPRWARLHEIGKFAPPPTAANHPTAEIIRTGRPLLVPDFDESWMRRITWSPRHLDLLRELNPHSVMFVPLSAHGSTVGTAIFAFSQSKRRHTESDLELAMELGRRAGLAVLHARQYEALRSSAQRLREMTDHQRVLISELSHRVRNTLAVVQAMASQTFKGDIEPQRASQAFSQRLLALSRAHDLLTRANWETTDLAELVADAIMPHQPVGADRILVRGGTVRVGPRQALALAMTLHELATNATKYGALSIAAGTVEVAWTVSGEGDPVLHLRWQERGGPPVSPPLREGFGSKLILRQLRSDLGGEASLRYEPEGLVCELRMGIQPPLAGSPEQ